jgi:hypothetical protein
MSASRLFVLCVAGLMATGCEDDELGPAPPIAAVRFVNAVADTGAMDFRVVDVIGDAPQFLENPFRAATPYQAVQAGTRHVRVWVTPSRSDTLAGSPMLWDTTFNFAAGTNYTVAMTGFARSGSSPALLMQIIADPAPTPAGGQIGLRVVNFGAGLGAIDAFWRRSADPAPGTSFAANLAFGGASSYLAVDTAALRVAVTSTGTTTPTLADVVGPAGVAGTPSANPIAGTRVAGSVLTAIFVPASVVGSQAPQTLTTPTVLYVADRRPAMTVQ